MHDDAFGSHVHLLRGEEEMTNAGFYGLDLGHASKLEAGAGWRSSGITRDCRPDLASLTPHPSRLNEDAAERKGLLPKGRGEGLGRIFYDHFLRVGPVDTIDPQEVTGLGGPGLYNNDIFSYINPVN